MSWDIIAIYSQTKIPKEDVLKYNFPDMGYIDVIIKNINEVVEGINWTDVEYPHISNGLYRGYFNIGIEKGICKDFWFHVYGGDDPTEVISKVCKANNWQAFDLTTGDYIDLIEPDEIGWIKFQFSRDEIRKAIENNPKLLNILKNKKWWEFWK